MCLNEGKITSIFGYFCVSTCPDKEKMKVSMKRHDNFNQDCSSKGSVPAEVIASYSVLIKAKIDRLKVCELLLKGSLPDSREHSPLARSQSLI